MTCHPAPPPRGREGYPASQGPRDIPPPGARAHAGSPPAPRHDPPVVSASSLALGAVTLSGSPAVHLLLPAQCLAFLFCTPPPCAPFSSGTRGSAPARCAPPSGGDPGRATCPPSLGFPSCQAEGPPRFQDHTQTHGQLERQPRRRPPERLQVTVAEARAARCPAVPRTQSLSPRQEVNQNTLIKRRWLHVMSLQDKIRSQSPGPEAGGECGA